MSKFSETFSKLKTLVVDFGKSQLSALNGIIDKLPEGVRKDFTTMRDALQGRQTEVEALFATVPADDDAATAFNGVMGVFTKLQDHCTAMMSNLQSALTAFQGTQTALQGFEKQIKDKELMNKDDVKSLTDASFQRGADSILPMVVSMRKSSVTLCGLPDMTEAQLKLPADQFDALLALGKKNIGALKEKFGFALNGRGDSWVKKHGYEDDTTFTETVKSIESVLPPGRAGDPMFGGGGGGGGTGKASRPVRPC